MLLFALTMSRPDPAREGRLLATRLQVYRGHHPLILGVAARGISVAAEVARHLDGEFDFVEAEAFQRPLENAQFLGGVSESGHLVLDGQPPAGEETETLLARVVLSHVFHLLERRNRVAPGRPLPNAAGRMAIVVGEALATGATLLAAVRSVRAQRPARLIVAAIAGTDRAVKRLMAEADEVVCPDVTRTWSQVARVLADHSAAQV